MKESGVAVEMIVVSADRARKTNLRPAPATTHPDYIGEISRLGPADRTTAWGWHWGFSLWPTCRNRQTPVSGCLRSRFRAPSYSSQGRTAYIRPKIPFLCR